MKIKKHILFLFFICAIWANAVGQMPSATMLKQSRMAAYQWVRDFSISRNFEGRRAVRNFSDAFTSRQDTIFHDYLPANHYPFDYPYVSVEGYAEMRMDEERRFDIEHRISSFSIIKERYEIDSVVFDVVWTELVRYIPTDITNKLLYPDYEFRMLARLVYNVSTKTIVSSGIRLAQPPIDPFVILHSEHDNIPTTLHDIENNSKRYETVLVHASVQQYPEDEKFYSVFFDTLENCFGVNLAIAVGGLGMKFAHPDRYENAHKSSSAFSIGIAYYRQLGLWGINRIGLEFSPAFRTLTYDWRLDYKDYCADIDPDGSPYERRVEVRDYSEQMHTYALSTPIALRYDRFLPSGRFSLFGRLGVNPMYSLSSKIEVSTANFHVSGYYPWLYNVVLDQEGIYDFGVTSENSFKDAKSPLSSFMMEAIVGMGVTWWMGNAISSELSINYHPLIVQSSTPEENWHLSPTTDTWQASVADIQSVHHHLVNFMLQINYHF